MSTILIVEKTGNIKELSIKTFNESELYKKTGHSSAAGFKCYTQWQIKDLEGKSYNISVYGKTTGRANQENKYEFPPPIDNTLFFGNCAIVNFNDEQEPLSLSSDEWDSIYEHLYGGFEDIEDDEEESTDGDDEYAVLPVTKSGYAKDGFVVDDDDDESDEYETEDDDADDDVQYKKPVKKTNKKKQVVAKKESKSKSNDKKKKKGTEDVENILTNTFTNVFNSIIQEPETYLDCASELSEESYV
jgi:hypothetical protein